MLPVTCVAIIKSHLITQLMQSIRRKGEPRRRASGKESIMQNTAHSVGRTKFLQRRVSVGEWLVIGMLVVLVSLLIGGFFMSDVLEFIPPILAMSSR